jgi:predicted metal-binding membrane protein
MSQWRDGAAGSFFMGLRHGAYCVGCCWALMASRLSSEDLVQYIVATSLAGIVPN